eukprot:1187663-Prorocentrum_minimum.AAC.6
MRPPPTDPLGDASRRRSARQIAWRGRASSRKPPGARCSNPYPDPYKRMAIIIKIIQNCNNRIRIQIDLLYPPQVSTDFRTLHNQLS